MDERNLLKVSNYWTQDSLPFFLFSLKRVTDCSHFRKHSLFTMSVTNQMLPISADNNILTGLE